MRILALVVVLAAGVEALDWQNTGELTGAKVVRDLIVGPDGHLYAAAGLDTASADSACVFVSPDLVTWERCGDIPGDVEIVAGLFNGVADTLFAGTGATYQGNVGPLLYSSSDKGSTWQFRSQITGERVGTTLTCVLETRAGAITAGHNYMAMHTSGAPCLSSDRGGSWSQGAVTGRIADMYCLLETADNNLFCGGWGTGGVVLKSSDGGANWAATSELYDAGHTRALVNGPAGAIFAGTYPRSSPQEPIGRVFKTTDAGASWQQLGYGFFNGTSGIRSLCWTTNGLLFAGSAPSAEVFVSSDSGVTWTSTGALPGAAYAAKLVEKTIGDSMFIYAGASNGDVFRAYVPLHVGVRSPATAPARTSVRLVPNPTRGELSLSLAGRAAVTVTDAGGRRVAGYTLEARQSRFALTGLAAGVYLVEVKQGTDRWTEPVLLLGRP